MMIFVAFKLPVTFGTIRQLTLTCKVIAFDGYDNKLLCLLKFNWQFSRYQLLFCIILTVFFSFSLSTRFYRCFILLFTCKIRLVLKRLVIFLRSYLITSYLDDLSSAYIISYRISHHIFPPLRILIHLVTFMRESFLFLDENYQLLLFCLIWKWFFNFYKVVFVTKEDIYWLLYCIKNMNLFNNKICIIKLENKYLK